MIEDKGHRGRVEVVDGQTGAGGLGCVVLGAAEAAAQGQSQAQVVEAARRTREGLEMWFCLDTLEYLRKGGRIGAAQALVGSALKIKPILTFGTEIAPVGKVRTKKRAMERMVAYLHELHERGASGWIVQHAQSFDDAATLVAAGEEIFGSEPLFCTQVGPVLGAHLGSGIPGRRHRLRARRRLAPFGPRPIGVACPHEAEDVPRARPDSPRARPRRLRGLGGQLDREQRQL